MTPRRHIGNERPGGLIRSAGAYLPGQPYGRRHTRRVHVLTRFRVGPTRNTARQGNTDSDRRTGDTQSVPHRQNLHASPAGQSCGTTASLPANAGFSATKASHTPCSRNDMRIIGTIPQQQLLTEQPGTMTGTQQRQANAIFRATAAAEPHPKGPLRPTPARCNRAWR